MPFSKGAGSGSGSALATPQFAQVLTAEATSSASYADLATDGPSVTVTVTASGIVLVGWNDSPSTAQGYCSIAISGANTVAASDNYPLGAAVANGWGRTYMFTGLVAGSTTFKIRYKSASGAVTFSNRAIWAIAF